MNRKFKLTTGLLFLLLAASMQLIAVEKTKEYHESWPANSVELLEITNKFGEVKVINNGSGKITVDVVITVEAPGERRAEELLDLISVSFSKTGNTVSARTNISNDFQSRQKFSIDYEVNIPSDKNLNITNKYGNTFVNVLNAVGKFDTQYGNITANELNAPPGQQIEINLGYGKADIGSAEDISATIQYSTVNLGQLGNLKLNTKYTVVNMGKAAAVTAESKYDNFNFEEVESLSVRSKYTNYKIGTVVKKLELESGYGGIRVDKVDSGFDLLRINSNYGQISLGLNNANYSLDASCHYCGISFPESRFIGDRKKELQSSEVKGRLGDGAGGEVYLKSRYGNIKLD